MEEAPVDRPRPRLWILVQNPRRVDPDLPVTPRLAIVQEAVPHVVEELVAIRALEARESLRTEEVLEGPGRAHVACTYSSLTKRLNGVNEQTV